MTEKERKKQIADYKKRVQDLTKSVADQKARKAFSAHLAETDPKAFSAYAKFSSRKRRGESAADIAASYSTEQKAAMRRSIEAAEAFSRKLIDPKK